MIVAFLIALLCALAGIGLLADLGLWLFKGQVVPGTIEDFEGGKPVLAFETVEGKKIRRRADYIAQISYRLGNPQVGDVFNVIYREDGGDMTLRVHGYLHAVAGMFLLAPLLGVVAVYYGKFALQGQLVFAVMFGVIVIVAWAGMKLVRRNY